MGNRNESDARVAVLIPVTFVVLTKNEANNVARALASIPRGADVLVVDAESQDATVRLARDAGARVVVRPWAGFVATRRFALGLVRTAWTFMLDADEALDPELAAAVAALEPATTIDAYRVARSTYFCGRPMRHGAWANETLLRLFRSDRATLVAEPSAGGEAEIHEHWVVPGELAVLPGTLLHDSYPTMRSYREKFDTYTSIEARGVRGSAAGVLRAAALAVARGSWHVVGRAAWRDGWRGIFVALASAFYPVVVAWKALRS